MREAKESGQLDSSRSREGSDKLGGAVDLRARRVAPSSASGGSWVDDDPFEWGYCRRTSMRKAPRSHYDHITKKLVLNMDHYW